MKKCVSLLILLIFSCPTIVNANGAMLSVSANRSNNYHPTPTPANVRYIYPFMYTQHSTGTHRRCTSTIRKCPVANNDGYNDRYYGGGNYYNNSNNNYYQTNNYYY